ncbi:MAG: metallophosphoesterase [Candidatus Nanoarchaeia archaeon]
MEQNTQINTQINIIKRLMALGELPTPEKINSFLAQNASQNISQSVPVKQISDEKDFVKILTKEDFTGKKIEPKDFVTYFRNRYSFYKNLVSGRPEFTNLTSISKLQQGERSTILAYVFDMKKLPTGTLKLVLEDLTGQIQAIISTKNPELIKKAKALTLDEVAFFNGSVGRNVFFIDDFSWPDIPFKTRNSTNEEVYLVCASDLHIGSNMFLPKAFKRFVRWLLGKYGNPKQIDLAKKVKYIVVTGDIIDGIGIYPGQEKELTIQDAYAQYDAAAKALAEIPSDKNIIILPGNHDALRICEPQPVLYKDLAAPLYELPNVAIAPNPSYVKLHAVNGSPGIDLLLYHGYSFDYFVDAVEALREAGGYAAGDKIWEFLLKRRHLAPTYGSTLALPLENDPLLITKVPDIAISGHIHKSKIGEYRGVLTISTSCFQNTTAFQQRMGHTPTPGRIPIVNLQTGKAWTLKFHT